MGHPPNEQQCDSGRDLHADGYRGVERHHRAAAPDANRELAGSSAIRRLFLCSSGRRDAPNYAPASVMTRDLRFVPPLMAINTATWSLAQRKPANLEIGVPGGLEDRWLVFPVAVAGGAHTTRVARDYRVRTRNAIGLISMAGCKHSPLPATTQKATPVTKADSRSVLGL
jgi:hypothetical protein